MVVESSPDIGNSAAPVYVSWTTFKHEILDDLTEGLPNKIDRTIFDGQAGSVQNQLMAALKFLGLIDQSGKPMQPLHDLTDDDEANRKRALALVLKERYAALFALGLDKTTMSELSETMESRFHVSNETKLKALRFFVSAVKYAEIPISKHIAHAPSLQRKRARRQQPTAEQAISAQVVAAPQRVAAGSSPGESRTVNLTSGETLTVTVSIGLMRLNRADRDFVLALIDQLDAYEKSHSVENEKLTWEEGEEEAE